MQAGQLLGPAPFGFSGLHAAGDVAGDALQRQQASFLIGDRRGLLLDPHDLRPSRCVPANLQRPGRRHLALQNSQQAMTILRMHHLQDQIRVGVQLIGQVADQAGDRRADILEGALGDQPVAEDDIRCVLDQPPVAILARLERPGDMLATHDRAEHPGRRARRFDSRPIPTHARGALVKADHSPPDLVR